MSKEGKILVSSTVTRSTKKAHEGSQIKLSPVVCTACDTGDRADSYCQQCNEHLCAECTKFHKRQKKTSGHIIIRNMDLPLSVKYENCNHCPKHKEDFITKICLTCKSLLCDCCLRESHKAHKIRPMGDSKDEIFNMYVNANKQLLCPVDEMKTARTQLNKTQKNVSDNCNAIEYTLRKRQDKLIDIIKKLTDSAIDQVRSTQTDLVSQFAESANKLDKAVQNCECAHTQLDLETDVNVIIKQILAITTEIKNTTNTLSKIDMLDKHLSITIGPDCADTIEEHAQKYLDFKTGINGSAKAKSDSSTGLVEIELYRGNKGLGLVLAGGQANPKFSGDNGILVSDIVEGGAAHQDGRFESWDKLVEINGVNVEHVTREEAVALINASKEKVVFLVAKFSYRQKISQSVNTLHADMQQSSTRQVLLRRGLSGFGLNLAGLNDGEGVFISYIHQGSPAESGGLLRKGDQLISVNGIDVQNATLEQAASVITTAGDIADISVIHRPSEYSRWETKVAEVRMSKNCRPNQKFIAQV